MTSGSYDIYSHPDGRTIYIYYIIPQSQQYWWILDKPSKTGNTVDELERLLQSICYEADQPPVLVPPSMLVTS
jgi:alkyl hydroperoxide reductase subunit AhpC